MNEERYIQFEQYLQEEMILLLIEILIFVLNN